jgi:hypothetical protein
MPEKFLVEQTEADAKFYEQPVRRMAEVFLFPTQITVEEWRDKTEEKDRVVVVLAKKKPVIGLNIPMHSRLVGILHRQGYPDAGDAFHTTLVVEKGIVQKVSVNEFTPRAALHTREVISMLPSECRAKDIGMSYGFKKLNLETGVISWDLLNEQDVIEKKKYAQEPGRTLIGSIPSPMQKGLFVVKYLDDAFNGVIGAI